MDLLTTLLGLAVIGIKSVASQSRKDHPGEKNLATALDSVIDTGMNVVKKESQRVTGEFNRGYEKSHNRYNAMSDEELKQEIDRLDSNRNSGFRRAGEVKAMSDEIKRRNEEKQNAVTYRKIR